MKKRNIKNGNFAWTQKWVWKKIETLPFKKQLSCKMIYTSICIASSIQRNSTEIEIYKFDIARYGSMSEKTVQRYLPDLENLGVIKLSRQDRKSNGKFEKVKIWLYEDKLTAGHLRDSSETDERQLEDTESDIYKKIKEESNKVINYIELFDDFRKSYPGKVRGIDPELNDFKRKHKNWKEITLLLSEALESQIENRDYFETIGEFVPTWKNLKTWLNQSCWTEELIEVKKDDDFLRKEYKKIGYNPFRKKYGQDEAIRISDSLTN